MHKFKLIIILVFLSNCFSILSNSNTNKNGEILFISSYNTEGVYVQNNISTFVDTYMHLNGKLIPVVESINCTTFNEKDKWIPRIKEIIAKHDDAKAIVLIGSESWMSFFSLTEEKYKKIPVFCIMGTRMNKDFSQEIFNSSISQNDNDVVDIKDKIKGFNVKLCYYYDYDMKRDVEFIKNLFPDTKNIAVISDNTHNGVSHRSLVDNYFKNNNKELKTIDINGEYINLTQALNKFKNLPPHTVAILCIWRFDKNGIFYTNNAEYAFKSSNDKLPVFSLTGTGIGNWTIGGYIPKYRTVGNELAKCVYNSIDLGIKIKPMIHGFDQQYRIDLNTVKKFNLLKTSLPKNAVYVNATMTIGELISIYKWYFVLALTIFIALSVSIILLIYYSAHMRKLKRNIEIIDQQLRKEKETLLRSQKELIDAKEEAEEANRMKSTFVSNMSHEIRTPLNAIVGFSDLLINSIDATKEQHQIIDIIKQNTDILLKLVNDILYISRIEANRMEFKFEKCNIIPYIMSTVASAGLAAKKGVKVEFLNKETEMMVCTDPIRLQQIVTNLIGNAAKFTEKGYISLFMKYDNKKSNLIFTVEDTGCGIPLEQQKYIFDRFKKLNEFVQGTGLGLSICKLTVEKLGGKIWIDNNYTNGTRFVFSIPVRHSQRTIKAEQTLSKTLF